MYTLYIVPTPIGNLEDITLRALRILQEVNLIAAEDTRTTKVLLNHFEIKTPLISYHEHNKIQRLDDIFSALATGNVALVSDAGTPGISDPGYELIKAAIEQDIPIVPLPGPNAAITALVASGLATDRFVFLGFPPRKTGQLRQFAKALLQEPSTMIFYESPHRIASTLDVFYEVFGERSAVVARELTKLYEELVRGTLDELNQHFVENPARGEITLLIEGAIPVVDEIWDEKRVLIELKSRLEKGEKRSAAVKAVAKRSGWDRREVYNLDI
jgi:16S rRNA (cytidine1402-2'-O)-methyltransferase